MSDHFVPLSCHSCGATLTVYDDMERFACGSCGTLMIAKRRGGTVQLECVTEAIRRVQVGTDRTAAELALVRLNEELNQALKLQLAQSKSENKSSVTFVAIVGAVFSFLAIMSGSTSRVTAGLPILAVCLIALWSAINHKDSDRLVELNNRVLSLKARIEEQRKIVDS